MSTSNQWFVVLVTVFAWWFSTGLILILVRAPRRWHKLLLVAFAAMAIAAAVGVRASADTLGVAQVYCGFLCALVIWGWHEASFLMGIVTGPRPLPCPENVRGWRRFYYATSTLIYHEVALFVTLVAMAVATYQSANQIALWTFTVLFVMRLSSKLNIFLGVPNLTDEFFPAHLEHLKSYLPKRRMNALMPFSVVASAAGLYWQWGLLADAGQGSALQVSHTIIITLTFLGLLEHLFMITPLPDAVLWRWAAPKGNNGAPAHDKKNNDDA